MQLGLCLYGLRDEDQLAVARAAEALGFESVWVPDHLALPVDIRSKYPYSDDGDSGLTHQTSFIDPWIALSFIGAQTTQIKLGTYVYLLPLRHPIMTAKTVGALAALSNGRVLMGIGMGWLAEEFAAVDMEFDHRIPRAREAIEVIRALWSDDVVEYHGEYFNIAAVGMAPKPADGSTPVLIGGHTNGAIRRAAAFGDGWIGSPALPHLLCSQLSEIMMRIEQQLEDVGRDRTGFEVTSGVVGLPTLVQATEAKDLGLDRLIVGPWLVEPTDSPALAIQMIQEFAESVLKPICH